MDETIKKEENKSNSEKNPRNNQIKTAENRTNNPNNQKTAENRTNNIVRKKQDIKKAEENKNNKNKSQKTKKSGEEPPMPQRNFTKKQKHFYKAKRFSFQDFKDSIPEELIPTKKTNYIFGGIFILIIIIGLFSFPLSEMMDGETELKFGFGVPLKFFVLDTKNMEEVPIKFFPLIFDLIIYIILAYVIDITINISAKTFDIKSKKSKIKVFKPKKSQKTKTSGEEPPMPQKKIIEDAKNEQTKIKQAKKTNTNQKRNMQNQYKNNINKQNSSINNKPNN